GALAALSLTMVMSLLASGASPVASAASAAVPASPSARAAAVLKSVSFDLIEGLLTQDLGGIRARQAYLSPANGRTNRERVGWNGVPIDDEKVIYPPGQAHGFLITLSAARGFGQ